jgi:hypothetical protein
MEGQRSREAMGFQLLTGIRRLQAMARLMECCDKRAIGYRAEIQGGVRLALAARGTRLKASNQDAMNSRANRDNRSRSSGER